MAAVRAVHRTRDVQVPSSRLFDLFRGVQPFSSLGEAALADLVSACEVVHHRGGTYLVRAGERLSAIHGVVHGALRVVRPGANGDHNAALREYYRGEVLGIVGMFAEREAPLDVLVMRDSTLARLPRERFVALTRKHPQLLDAFAHVMGEHLLDLLDTVSSGDLESALPFGGNIALIGLSRDPTTQRTTRDLFDQMTAEPNTAGVTAEIVDSALGTGAAEATKSSTRVAEWLSELEIGKRAVVYASGPITPEWMCRCIRQSDRVVIVMANGDEACLEELAPQLVGPTSVPRQIHLVLLHRAGTELPSGTRALSRLTNVSRVHHVRAGERRDVERVVRLLVGRPVGVALSGGGARGIAHLGVLAALSEAHIPIDYICGTSMGAIFAAATAQGWSVERQRDSVRELFASPFALYDFTVPVSSILAGKKLDRVMQKYYRDAEIEDLWLPFFCVSTDLSRGLLVVHERGSVWQSVRASCSIPGIFPPHMMAGRALVDGGLMDNLPIDLLAERCPGSLIAVDVYPYGDETFTKPAGVVSPRIRALRSRIKGEPASPPLFDILIRSTLAGSKYRQATAASRLKHVHYLEPPVGSFGILSWRSHAELFDAGYRYAKQQLSTTSFEDVIRALAA